METQKNLHDEIAKVAYELHVKKGAVNGSDLEDWLEAERIVTARRETGAEKMKPGKPSKTASRKRK